MTAIVITAGFIDFNAHNPKRSNPALTFTLHLTAKCGFSKRLKRPLTELEITFQEIDIE